MPYAEKLLLVVSYSGTVGGGWMENLPFVLLGLRSAVRDDAACSPADLLYGSPLRLPGPMLSPSSLAPPDPASFAAHLRGLMLTANPVPVSYHGTPPSRVDPLLAAASHVFLRGDAVRRPLVPPYDGPFPVIKRSAKVFDILKGNKTITVSVDHLKPASGYL